MVQEETTLITNYTFQSAFDVRFLPPPFYFLAEELILIVALQQGSLSIPGSSSLLSAAAAAAAAERERARLQDWVQSIAQGAF